MCGLCEMFCFCPVLDGLVLAIFGIVCFGQVGMCLLWPGLDVFVVAPVGICLLWPR